VLATLAGIFALRAGAAVVLPIVFAVLLTLLLSTPVRWLHAHRLPERAAAALVVFGALGAAAGVAAVLANPATEWIASAPETMQKLEAKLRQVVQPLTEIQRSADKLQHATQPATGEPARTVQLAAPGIVARMSLDTVASFPVVLTVVFLTYFLLANGPLFRRKLATLLPGRDERKRREHLLGEIELAASRFLVTVVLVNAGVGLLTGLALWGVGMPSPFMWGALAAVLNFVPYLGPVVTAPIIGLAALASIDNPTRALLAPAAFLAIHLVETNFVTPILLGRHLPVNTVALFLGLLFFGWMWGVPGAVLAVPLTVCVKLVCDHTPSLAHVGELLGN
jgi:predicted PurR-regulated permease PerM